MEKLFGIGESVMYEEYEIARGGQTSHTIYGDVIKLKDTRLLIETKSGERFWLPACNCYISNKKDDC